MRHREELNQERGKTRLKTDVSTGERVKVPLVVLNLPSAAAF